MGTEKKQNGKKGMLNGTRKLKWPYLLKSLSTPEKYGDHSQ